MPPYLWDFFRKVDRQASIAPLRLHALPVPGLVIHLPPVPQISHHRRGKVAVPEEGVDMEPVIP